jgi:hypothetical protein
LKSEFLIFPPPLAPENYMLFTKAAIVFRLEADEPIAQLSGMVYDVKYLQAPSQSWE